MKKALTIIVVVGLLCGITALAYGKGPVPKATGGVETIYPLDRNPYRASFNAHELSPPPTPLNTANGKGQVEIKDLTIPRDFYCVVKYVNVFDDDSACFAAQIASSTDGSYLGEWFYVMVKDGGTPGTAGDYIGWDPPTPSEAAVWGKVMEALATEFFSAVTKGNLVVH